MISWRSRASPAERKRRVRCWFILARGATPSMARKRTRRGRTAAKMRSTYIITFTNISASVFWVGRCHVGEVMGEWICLLDGERG